MRETGAPVDVLDRRPEIPPHLRHLWDAFVALCGSRPCGFGVGPIPVSEVLAYCALMGVNDAEDRFELLTVIQAMDAVFVAKYAQAQK